MTETLISFKTAKLAKEKGFSWLTSRYYDEKGNLIVEGEESNGESEYSFDADSFQENWNYEHLQVYINKKYHAVCSASSQALLQKWLREVHNIHLCILRNDKMYYYNIQDEQNNKYLLYFDEGISNKYEEALEKGLLKALKLINEKKK